MRCTVLEFVPESLGVSCICIYRRFKCTILSPWRVHYLITYDEPVESIIHPYRPCTTLFNAASLEVKCTYESVCPPICSTIYLTRNPMNIRMSRSLLRPDVVAGVARSIICHARSLLLGIGVVQGLNKLGEVSLAMTKKMTATVFVTTLPTEIAELDELILLDNDTCPIL